MTFIYRIGEFSKLGKTTIKTLRHYDEVGLLTPAFVDEENGYRYYTTKQLLELHNIVSLRQMGFSIPSIISYLNNQGVDQMLEQKKQELLSEQAEIDDQLSRLNSFILTKKEGDNMNYQAVVKELPECIVYSKKLRVPNYDSYFEIIPEIGREVLKANPDLKCAVPEYCFIVYLDGEYKEKDFNIEFCEAVTKKGTDTKDIKFKEIKSETAVTVMHKGNYETLPKAYAFIFQWIEDNDYKSTGLPRENYIDGIWNKKNSDDWLTEIQVPITKK